MHRLCSNCVLGTSLQRVCFAGCDQVGNCMRSGASCTAKNLDGKTAVEVAQLNNQNSIVAIFEKENTFL